MNPSQYPEQWSNQQYQYSSTYPNQQLTSYDGAGNLTYSQDYSYVQQGHRSHYPANNQPMTARQSHHNYQTPTYSQPLAAQYSQSQNQPSSYDQPYSVSPTQGQSYAQSRPRSHSQALPYAQPQTTVLLPHANQYPGQIPLASDSGHSQYDYSASSSRPFSCELCSLSFNRQHDLKRHRETHSGEKPYNCNGGCGKTFTRKDALKRHQIVKGCGRVDDGWS